MGREVRMVPAGWEHPKDYRGNYRPLLYGYRKDFEEFKKYADEHGLENAVQYYGGGPVADNYMLADTDPGECTMLMMYEDTSEGTPISPAFKTPEELARWLADNNASAFGNMTATYEQWLETCKRGWAMSAMYTPEDGLVSGVSGMSEH